ncbi:hypothetical protein S100892_01294 [Pediococcus pentosaceus]|uniref:Tail fiber assembly protein n=1 Tax=Pediococcus pentosaceus TaxID=1255 RepID=A0A1Y0VZC6_PEDPE|nr:hypothetical protein S100892_01294 [Pediococcus pentosaceus]
MNYDNSVLENVYVYEPLNPWGYNVLILNEGEEVPSGCTTIVPPDIDRPKFNSDTQKWESAPASPVAPSEMQQIVIQQAKTIAQMQQMLMQQSKDIAELKGANA